MRNEQQATTEVPKWFRKWNNQQATTEEAPKWFQRWNEEREAKRKSDSAPSKSVLIKIIVSKIAKDILSVVSSSLELYKIIDSDDY